MSMEKNDYIVYEAKKWTRGGVDLSPLPPCHDFNQTLTRLVGEGTAALRDEVLFARYGEKTWPTTRHRCEFDARPFQSFDIGRKNARNPFFFLLSNDSPNSFRMEESSRSKFPIEFLTVARRIENASFVRKRKG